MSTGVEISVVDAVQVIRFARPEKKNALTGATYTAITGALAAGDASHDVAAHLFVGSNGVFTAGNDIGDFLASATGAQGLSDPVLGFLRALPAVKKPMIAAVDGLAVGIGTTLMFHCDLVYATPAASFRTPFVDLGLVPEAGSSLLAPRVMGYARAFELLVLGQPFTGEAAHAAGFVNAVVAVADLEASAMAAAVRLARKPPDALLAARRLMRGSADDVSRAIEDEVRIFAERMRSPEANEAFTAFMEKRAPDFQKLRG
ncbi:MAG: crotonase/enoyl-CoA hydratase family protein [Hyphomicrobiaceae bacterium]|nr:crotonase/enoyl-CoA hydratase family protein [Hyphomicrobiaceae bacterium]